MISLQKIFGLYGLKPHIVEISGDVTDAGRRRTNERTREDSALSQWTVGKLSDQLYVCKNLVKLFVYVSYKNLMIS